MTSRFTHPLSTIVTVTLLSCGLLACTADGKPKDLTDPSSAVSDMGTDSGGQDDLGSEALCQEGWEVCGTGCCSTIQIAEGVGDLSGYGVASTPDGEVYVSYVKRDEDSLMLVRIGDGDLEEQRVHKVDGDSHAVSLVSDTTGKPHLAWTSSDRHLYDLHYASMVDGLLSVTQIDTTNPDGADVGSGRPSIAVGSDGVPRIAYEGEHFHYSSVGYDVTHLRYAELRDGRWTAEIAVAKDYDSGYSPSLAVNNAGEAFISFFETITGENVYLAKRTRDSITVNNIPNETFRNAPAIVSVGSLLHGVAFDHVDNTLVHGVLENGRWTRNDLVERDIGGHPNIGVDGLGRVHITYEKRTRSDAPSGVTHMVMLDADTWSTHVDTLAVGDIVATSIRHDGGLEVLLEDDTRTILTLVRVVPDQEGTD